MMRHMAVVAVAGLTALAGAVSPAAAAVAPDPGSGGYPSTTPSSSGNTRGIAIRGLRLSGDVGSPDTSHWEGPACWRVPWMSGAEYANRVERVQNHTGEKGENVRLPPEVAQHEDEEGNWYRPASNGTSDGAACASALNPPVVWVGEGDPPPPQGITPAILAQIARAYLDLPAPNISLNPQPPRRSYVGMGTWVWAQPVQQQLAVTAALPELDMAATVTAVRRDLVVDPGTADPGRYRMHPCTGLGKPFPAGASRRAAEQDPPCGVTYLRSSSDQPAKEYTLTAQLTWGVNWQGSDGTGGAMAPATLGDSIQVPVGEVQTAVRD
jgi:enoyl reductase